MTANPNQLPLNDYPDDGADELPHAHGQDTSGEAPTFASCIKEGLIVAVGGQYQWLDGEPVSAEDMAGPRTVNTAEADDGISVSIKINGGRIKAKNVSPELLRGVLGVVTDELDEVNGWRPRSQAPFGRQTGYPHGPTYMYQEGDAPHTVEPAAIGYISDQSEQQVAQLQTPAPAPADQTPHEEAAPADNYNDLLDELGGQTDDDALTFQSRRLRRAWRSGETHHTGRRKLAKWAAGVFLAAHVPYAAGSMVVGPDWDLQQRVFATTVFNGDLVDGAKYLGGVVASPVTTIIDGVLH